MNANQQLSHYFFIYDNRTKNIYLPSIYHPRDQKVCRDNTQIYFSCLDKNKQIQGPSVECKDVQKNWVSNCCHMDRRLALEERIMIKRNNRLYTNEQCLKYRAQKQINRPY